MAVQTEHLQLAGDSGPGKADLEFQARLLPAVSRTFALTIPAMPRPLSDHVTNAYLLCRIADTVEDDQSMDPAEKLRLLRIFLAVLDGQARAEDFVRPCLQQLHPATPEMERRLVADSGRVTGITARFDPAVRAPILRCVRVMSEGMAAFSSRRSVEGLEDIRDLNDYCYVVAGCVGEMLTDLFAVQSPAVAEVYEQLFPLSRWFGQGLQMTNILKDVWEDRQSNACWLPREFFAERGVDLGDLPGGRDDPRFGAGMRELVGLAHDHLRTAMDYTLLIPKAEIGIRHSCLWPIGLAVFTLRRIHRNPHFGQGSEVKISRRTVKGVVAVSSVLTQSNRGLGLAFRLATMGLPRSALPADIQHATTLGR